MDCLLLALRLDCLLVEHLHEVAQVLDQVLRNLDRPLGVVQRFLVAMHVLFDFTKGSGAFNGSQVMRNTLEVCLDPVVPSLETAAETPAGGKPAGGKDAKNEWPSVLQVCDVYALVCGTTSSAWFEMLVCCYECDVCS